MAVQILLYSMYCIEFAEITDCMKWSEANLMSGYSGHDKHHT